MDKETPVRDSQTKAIELEERLIDFAGRIIRSGTSPAPNYGEARGAESHADFVHKIGIVLKELNETSIWLRIINRSEMLKKELLTGIIEENRELCRIFTASVTTARANRR